MYAAVVVAVHGYLARSPLTALLHGVGGRVN